MQNWEIKKLSDICSIQTGKHDANHATETGKYRFYTCAAQYLWCDTVRFSGECLILPGNGVNVGEVYYYNGDFDAYQRTYVISEISKDVYARFLYYNMLLNWKQNGTAKQYGSATNFIKIGNFLEYEIPLPPLEEQKRIVKILDEKFARLETVKANAKNNLQNAKDLFQSQLTKAFSNTTWEKKRLGDCGSFKNGMNFASTDTGYTIRSLGVGDFKNLYQIDDTEQLSEISLKAAPSDDYLLKDGDIVFVRSNGNKELVGRCLLVYPKNIPTTYSGFCIRFRKDYDELDADFLLHYMKAESSRKILNGKEGANISNLNQKILGDFEVPVPPLPEQKRIVEQLDSLSEKVRSLEEIYTKQLANCDELKQAFLAKAFNGEL